MSPILGTGLISGISNLANSFSNWFTGKRNMERQYNYSRSLAQQQQQYNMELAQRQFDLSMDAWRQQTEYNTPANQMARFKAAGLNPALIYGRGNAGNADSAPQYREISADLQQQQPLQRPAFNLSGFDAALNAISRYASVLNLFSQNDNLVQQNANLKADALLKETQAGNLSQEMKFNIGRYGQESRLWNTQFDYQRNLLEQSRWNLRNAPYENLSSRLKAEMLRKDRENYIDYGVRPQDSILYRLGVELMKGLSKFNLFKN